MSNCATIDLAVLERTKMDKVLPKIVKRGDAQGKMFAQKVLANAAAVSKQKSLDSKSPQSLENKDMTLKKGQSLYKTSSDASCGSKGPQLGAETASQSQKKGTVASTPAASSNSGTNTKAGNLLSKKPLGADSKVMEKGNSGAATATKVKTTVVAPKPTSFFSSLQSASKKPGTSNAALKSAKSKDGYVISHSCCDYYQ